MQCRPSSALGSGWVIATWRSVRRIALELPESAEKTGSDGTATWTVRGKAFAWERPLRRSDLEALGDSAPSGAILGVRTPDLELKEALLLSDPAVFFTTPHFDGYSAVLIVLAKIKTPTLHHVILEGWLARAPARVADAFLAGKKNAPVTRLRNRVSTRHFSTSPPVMKKPNGEMSSESLPDR